MLQVADSFFPVGGYALSFGLETISQRGLVRGSSDVGAILRTLLAVMSRTDCVAFRAAYSASEKPDLAAIARLELRLASLKNVKGFYEASVRTGRAQVRTVASFVAGGVLERYREMVKRGDLPGLYPVCLAVTCRQLGVEPGRGVIAMLYSVSISLLGAAVRLGHISSLEAQGMLHLAKPDIIRAGTVSAGLDERDMAAFSPFLDIMGMQHVYLPSRMFAC